MIVSEKNALAGQIGKAFAERAYPGDDRIAMMRPECCGYEGNGVAEYFRGRDWRSISFEAMFRAPDSPLGSIPSFLTVEGFAYYLPAFLIIALDIDPADTSLLAQHHYTFVQSLCFHLKRPSPNALRERYDLVKDMPEVPDEIKLAMRDPTPEALDAQRQIVANHERLIAILSDAEREALARTLVYLVPMLDNHDRDEAGNNKWNDARQALATSWACFLKS